MSRRQRSLLPLLPLIASLWAVRAEAAKVVIVRSHNLPGIALPIAGGLVFSLLVAVWLTSGLWFISENGFPSP